MASNSNKPRRVAFMLGFNWPHKRHADMFAGAHKYAQEQAWESTIDEYVDEELPVRPTKSLPYDGVIARAPKPLAQKASQLGLPVVNVWYGSPARKQLPGVFSDLAATGKMCAEHLMARGLRRFAVLRSRDCGSRLQTEAFKATVQKQGFTCVTTNMPLSVLGTYAVWQKTKQGINTSMKQWQLPMGVFTPYDGTGRMVAQICRHRGWRVPHDVAIISGQNEESMCERPRPSLTSVEYGFERVGYEAAKLLGQLMDGQSPPTEPLLIPAEHLVVRESTDFHAVDDPLVAAALAFIASNSNRAIGAEDVALGVETGLRSLQRQFREYLGRPISAEIQYARLERAKRELTQSDRPIKKIAHDVGFGRAMRMYEVFRRELGVTPREYRNQRRSESEV